MLLLADKDWEARTIKGKGRGIFVKKNIAGGKVIGDYIGKAIRVTDEDNYDKGEHFYTMYYSDSASIFPDSKKPGIHLFNHSCAPNCWMYTYRGHTLYFALRHIFTDEELTVSYQLSPEDKYCNPCTHLCHCGSVLCLQTMHLSEEKYNKWHKFDDEIAEKTKRERIKINKELEILDEYPVSVPDNPIYTLFGAKEKYSVSIQAKNILSTKEVRNIIRETGRTIAFPRLNLRIHGVLDNLLISEALS